MLWEFGCRSVYPLITEYSFFPSPFNLTLYCGCWVEALSVKHTSVNVTDDNCETDFNLFCHKNYGKRAIYQFSSGVDCE